MEDFLKWVKGFTGIKWLMLAFLILVMTFGTGVAVEMYHHSINPDLHPYNTPTIDFASFVCVCEILFYVFVAFIYRLCIK